LLKAAIRREIPAIRRKLSAWPGVIRQTQRMTIRLTYLAIAAAAAFLAGSLARAQERYDHKVRNDFFAGFTGDNAALARGLSATEATLKENPDHAEALVWHGAGVYYQAGQAFQAGEPQKGMDLAMKGLAEMDRAVELAPENVAVRIPRGSVLIAATRFQQGPHVAPLLAKGVSDYEKTWELQQSDLARLGTHSKGELLLGLADGYSRMGAKDKATSFYERAAKELPGTPYEKPAKEWLETGKLEPRKAGCLGCHTGN
jgi:tetratricopeptide (TPR) repeat protein